VDVTQTAADKAWATTTRRLSDGANIVLAKGVGLTGLTDLSASDVEDAVWDAVMADHITANSTGAKLNSAGAASDPWSIDLPGAYAAGSAGYILGNQLDVNVAAVNGVAVTGAGTALNPWGPV